MKWLSNFFRKYRGHSSVSRSIQGLKNKAQRINRECLASSELVEKRLKALDKLEKLHKEEIASSRQALEQSLNANKKLQEALQASEEHIKTLEEITIPGLVAANALFVDRWQAESAVLVMRQTLAKDDSKG
jgi:hypothetical protein